MKTRQPTVQVAARRAIGASRTHRAESAVTEHARDLLSRAAATHSSLQAWDERRDDDVEVLLRDAMDQELERLRDARADDEVAPVERARHVAELQNVYLELREVRVQRRIAAYERAQDGLERLRQVASSSKLLERVARDVCDSCGFERGVLSKVEDSAWVLADAHFEGNDEWAEAFVRFGSEARPTLARMQPETQMARGRAPALVTDAINDPSTHKPFVAHAEVRCYVGAPIMPRGRAIGFLHADHGFSGRPVDALDRDTLWAFTLGFAYVYERTVLLERLRDQRSRIEDLTASTATLVSDLCDGDIDGTERLDHALVRGRIAALADRDGGESPLLTPRERDVLSLMAAGATNAVIGRELFISEGTVKSHVKRILRKLNASTRAEAVAVHLRAQVRRRDESHRSHEN